MAEPYNKWGGEESGKYVKSPLSATATRETLAASYGDPDNAFVLRALAPTGPCDRCPIKLRGRNND